MSDFSNSDSVDDLFEENRLHLTVNPLAPFRPTIRPDTYPQMYQDWPQYQSPLPISPAATPDIHVNMFSDRPEDILVDFNTTFSDDGEFTFSDYVEADLFSAGNANLAEQAVLTQEPLSSQGDLFNAEFNPDPATLGDLATFDDGFWFAFHTDVVVPESPRPDALVGNSNVHPQAPEEIHRMTPIGNPFVDDPPTYSGSVQYIDPVDLVPIPPWRGQGPVQEQQAPPQLFHPRPIPIPHKIVQQELPELDFTTNPIVDSDLDGIDFSVPMQRASFLEDLDLTKSRPQHLSSPPSHHDVQTTSPSATMDSPPPTYPSTILRNGIERALNVNKKQHPGQSTPHAEINRFRCAEYYHRRRAEKLEKERKEREARDRETRLLRLPLPAPVTRPPLRLIIPQSSPQQIPRVVYPPRQPPPLPPRTVLPPPQQQQTVPETIYPEPRFKYAKPPRPPTWHQVIDRRTGRVVGYVPRIENIPAPR